MKKNVLIFSGSGFVSSHIVRLFTEKYLNYEIYNIDECGYFSNLENLVDLEIFPNYHFIKNSLIDEKEVIEILSKYNITDIIHCGLDYFENIEKKQMIDEINKNHCSLFNLFNASNKIWGSKKKLQSNHTFFHVSSFDETFFLDIKNNQSTIDIKKEDIVKLFLNSDLSISKKIISTSQNIYGPNQFPQNKIPKIILELIEGKDFKINLSDLFFQNWLYVKDHACAIDQIFHSKTENSTFNIKSNLILNDLQLLSNSKSAESESNLDYIFETVEQYSPVEDFNSNFQDGISWSPKYSFKRGIKETYDWYKKSKYWISRVENLEYLNYKILGL